MVQGKPLCAAVDICGDVSPGRGRVARAELGAVGNVEGVGDVVDTVRDIVDGGEHRFVGLDDVGGPGAILEAETRGKGVVTSGVGTYIGVDGDGQLTYGEKPNIVEEMELDEADFCAARRTDRRRMGGSNFEGGGTGLIT